MKFKRLVCLLILESIFCSNSAKAVSEMDILMEEKKNEANISSQQNKEDIKGLSFTDMIMGKDKVIKDKKDEHKIDADANASESWLKSLFKSGKKDFLKANGDDSAEQEILKEKLEIKERSNAAQFDISGVKLKMSPKEVEEVLIRQGYRKITESMEIPNFIEWRAEELCRINGVVGFERLNACKVRIAQYHGYQFIEKQIYNRHLTRETIEVNFTSSFTDNLSYRVHYKSSLPMSYSKASKNVYINNLKIFDFWKRIDLKYGEPDNTTEVKWGLGGKKPYMQAKTGELELVDPLLISLDSTRMYNEDSRLANTQYYTF